MKNTNIKRKIYVVGGKCYSDYVNWIIPLGFEITDRIEDSHIIFMAGGEDCNPKYYEENCGKYTGFNDERDKYERDIYFKYLGKKAFAGVCRGCQQLGYLSHPGKSKLIQHSGHPSLHESIDNNDKNNIITCTSSHHQQVLLDEKITGLEEGKDYKLLLYSENLSPFHLDGNNKDYNLGDNYKEIECAYIPSTNAWLCQSHPEWQLGNYTFNKSIKFFQKSLMDNLIL